MAYNEFVLLCLPCRPALQNSPIPHSLFSQLHSFSAPLQSIYSPFPFRFRTPPFLISSSSSPPCSLAVLRFCSCPFPPSPPSDNLIPGAIFSRAAMRHRRQKIDSHILRMNSTKFSPIGARIEGPSDLEKCKYHEKMDATFSRNHKSLVSARLLSPGG